MPQPSEQSFAKALFHGVIAEEMVFPFPALAENERAVVDELVGNLRRLGDGRIDSERIDRERHLDPALMDSMRDLGVFGVTVPETYGGLGLGIGAAARIVEAIGTLDASLGAVVGSHLALGMAPLVRAGSESQKARWLPALARGEKLAAFALTEPRAGSDAAAVHTRVERSLDGAGYVVNGNKAWITGAELADVFVVFARAAASAGHPRITALMVERGPGVRVGQPEPLIGLRGTGTASLSFHDALVPSRDLVGVFGKGFYLAMETLNLGRLVLAAACLGGAKRCLRDATERVTTRHAFGRSISQYGMVREKIAQMSSRIYAAESALYLTTGLVDRGMPDFGLEAALCNVLATETYDLCARLAADLAGAVGLAQGFAFERHLRDARAHLILTGTNEILRAFSALSGMKGPSTRYSDVERAMRGPIRGFGALTDFAVKRARAALGRERLTSVHPALRAEAVAFEEGVGGLAREVERVLRKHGTEVSSKQFVQRRVADVAVDLYAISAVLSRTDAAITARGEESARGEIELSAAFSVGAEERIRHRLSRMERDEDELMKSVAEMTYAEGHLPARPV